MRTQRCRRPRYRQITVDYGDNSCQAMDVLAHLTGDRIRNKFSA
ncbi:MAG: hypothetical protein R3C26_13340 [Calditrichia bacterium]